MAKVSRNQERDQNVWRQLEAKGWSVIIVWECQLKKATFENTVTRVSEEIIQNGAQAVAERESRRAAREAYLQEKKARQAKEKALSEEIKHIR